MATYADPNSASADFDVLKAAEGHDLDIRGAVVKNRDADGIGALLVYAGGFLTARTSGRRMTYSGGSPSAGMDRRL